LVTRAAKGMLGGMRALPDDGWHAGCDGAGALPFAGEWRDGGQVEHTFSHFHLTLRVALYSGEVPATLAGDDGDWWPVDRIEEAGLPTLYAKAARRALAARGDA
ncbi:MAG: NUDIX domain-containing protein, partial [Novosphingobium sp.]